MQNTFCKAESCLAELRERFGGLDQKSKQFPAASVRICLVKIVLTLYSDHINLSCCSHRMT